MSLFIAIEEMYCICIVLISYNELEKGFRKSKSPFQVTMA